MKAILSDGVKNLLSFLLLSMKTQAGKKYCAIVQYLSWQLFIFDNTTISLLNLRLARMAFLTNLTQYWLRGHIAMFLALILGFALIRFLNTFQ